MSVFRKFIIVSLVAVGAIAFAAVAAGRGHDGGEDARRRTPRRRAGRHGDRAQRRRVGAPNGRVVGDVTPLQLSFWEAIPDENGDWTKELFFPVGIEPGEYTIHATCDFTQASMGVGAAGARSELRLRAR